MNALLLKLSQLEFSALDLQLYIDTHPSDREAIAAYNKMIREASKVREEYERIHGPLYSYISLSNPEKFTWIEEPWPWEQTFNQ